MTLLLAGSVVAAYMSFAGGKVDAVDPCICLELEIHKAYLVDDASSW